MNNNQEKQLHLYDEKLETVLGGASGAVAKVVRRTKSAPAQLESAPFHDSRPSSPASPITSPGPGARNAVHDERTAHVQEAFRFLQRGGSYIGASLRRQ
jgi:hypothetical protein